MFAPLSVTVFSGMYYSYAYNLAVLYQYRWGTSY